jgi:hypothetical protein
MRLVLLDAIPTIQQKSSKRSSWSRLDPRHALIKRLVYFVPTLIRENPQKMSPATNRFCLSFFLDKDFIFSTKIPHTFSETELNIFELEGKLILSYRNAYTSQLDFDQDT